MPPNAIFSRPRGSTNTRQIHQNPQKTASLAGRLQGLLGRSKTDLACCFAVSTVERKLKTTPSSKAPPKKRTTKSALSVITGIADRAKARIEASTHLSARSTWLRITIHWNTPMKRPNIKKDTI